MNLIIDVGNTKNKLAVFTKGKLVKNFICTTSDLNKTYEALKLEFPNINSGIVSSVGVLKPEIIKAIVSDINLLVLNHQTKLPFNNLYKTPKTLGVDRLALVSASVKEFPDKNVLIIDVGTCITYDFKTKNNDYLGGAISPGIRLRYKSLNNLTANLPLLETKKPNQIIGDSTEEAIHSGVITGIVKEIDGLINDYSKNFPDLTVILTGGDAKFLSDQLKNSIFANSNFLLEGLNFILEFNSK